MLSKEKEREDKLMQTGICKWGNTDCINESMCILCAQENFYYKPKKIRPQMKKRAVSQDKRMGSVFEYSNHQKNENIVNSRMTLNSGATVKEKGDEQISGIIEIMEELKTKVKEEAPGKQTFTIKKAWLEKLNREAKVENKEFWYLKFCFHESETDEVYIIVEQDIIMSMIKTMIEDRKKAHVCDSKIALLNKRIDTEKSMRIKAECELAELKEKINLLKLNEEVQKIFSSKIN